MHLPPLREATLHEPHETPLVLGYRPRTPVAGVELLGEFENWLTPLPMRPTERGVHEASLRLGPGVYAYKLRHDDGSYHLDPENPRTRSQDGTQNSVLVLDGSAEPILHAPVPGYLQREPDGLWCVRAALRHGHGRSLALCWDEGQGECTRPMACVAAEGEHLLFEVRMPASSERVRYLFVLEDGRPVGREGSHARHFTLEGEPLHALPRWWQEGVMYGVFVDRFRRGRGQPFHPLSNERGRAGGDLWGVLEALPYLARLGINILQLTPLSLSPSAHRYDAIDPRVVDPALGGEEALRAVLDAAHALDLRVLLDLGVTHVHRDHAAFLDVRRRGPDSPYWDWFHAHHFPFEEGPDGGYLHYQKGQWQEPLLRLNHAEVLDYVVGHFEHYARLGVDGFRLDAACSMPVGFARRVRKALHAIRPDLVLWGEVTVDNGARWLSAGALDAVTDFVSQDVERRFLRGELGAREAAQHFTRRRYQRAHAGTGSISFTANHDQPRLLTLLEDRALARAAHVLLLARAQLPSLYYGDEIGLRSESPRAWEDAWPDRACMPWDEAEQDAVTRATFTELIALRRSSRTLREGDEQWLEAESPTGEPLDDVLILRRRTEHETLDVFLSRADVARSVVLPKGAPSGASVLVRAGEATASDGELRLGPKSAAIVRRELPPEVSHFWRDSLDRASELAHHAFEIGATEVPCLPPRLYLTVTERCNLRCGHCITHAPRLTSEGRARSMEPWVFERLRDAFAAASYLGFVHGGESMVSPHFFDLLRAAHRARHASPGRLDVHLLTNGMLLHQERARALLDHGVTSLAVSLDGASPATNDKLRVGGKFASVVKNVEQLVALRAQRRADLRVGISYVVTRSNVHELPKLAALCASLGVDWLKLEEIYPVNECARREHIEAAQLDDAMAQLRAALTGGIVLVDHLRDEPRCACADSAEARAFRAADDFANRACFRPCRMLWEQAAVDPDGQVRPVDYARSALGSLLDHSFVELWNGPALRAARARVSAAMSHQARLCCVRSEGHA